MTPKKAVLVSAAVVVVGTGAVLRLGSLVVLAIPLVAYIVLAGLVAGEPHLLVSAKREADAGKVFEGGVFELSTKLTNEGGRLGLLRAEDTLPRGLKIAEGSNVGFAILAKGEGLEMRYKLTSDAPGSYTVGPIVLTATDSFGLQSKVSMVESTFQLDVLPRVEHRRGVAFRPRKTQNWSGQVVSPRPGSGADFYAVRQYVSTDPARTVNWKAWARLDKMYSNQYMSELGADAVIVVDKSSASDFGVPPESALTYVERCSAAVSSGLLFSGNRVGMVLIGEGIQRVYPGTGRKQLERILLTLVRAKKGPAESLGLLPEYLSFWFPRALNLIVISSLANPDILAPLLKLGARRDLEVMSPSFTGSRVGGPKGDTEEVALLLIQLKRRAVAEQLRRYATVVEWEVDVPIETVLERALLGGNRMVAR